MIHPRYIIALIVCVAGNTAGAQRPSVLAPNAPKDRPANIREQCEWDRMLRVLEPYVRQARATYPAAKQRFLAGLPPRHTFFVTVRLTDSLMHHEQVFLAVDSIVDGRIAGRIASEIALVRGFARRDPYTVRETDLIDWLIAKPDGSEDGNIVGKFMDTYRPPTTSCEGRDKSG